LAAIDFPGPVDVEYKPAPPKRLPALRRIGRRLRRGITRQKP